MWEMMLGWPSRRSADWKRPESTRTVAMMPVMAMMLAMK